MRHDGGAREQVHVNALDVSVTVDISGASADRLAASVRTAWSRSLATIPGDERVSADAGTTAGHAAELAALTSRITATAVRARAGDLLMLHAAALADLPSGRTVVLVGPSGAGKTTAVRVLGQHLGYLTDEAVGVDAAGRVVGYPKPLSVVASAGGPKQQLSPDALGLLSAPPTCRVAAVAVLDRRDTVDSPTVETVPMVAALAALAPETSSLARLPRPLHRLADLLDSAGGLRRIRYREAEELLALLPLLLREAD